MNAQTIYGSVTRVGAWLREGGRAFRGTGGWSDASRWDQAVAAGYRLGVLDERERWLARTGRSMTP